MGAGADRDVSFRTRRTTRVNGSHVSFTMFFSTSVGISTRENRSSLYVRSGEAQENTKRNSTALQIITFY